MPGASRLATVGREDAVALLLLAGTAAIVSAPIWRGGYLTYIDNSVHIAEILELSRNEARGWSEIAFAGFPLGTLHSPVWYPLLAVLVRAGIPVGPLYAAALLAGFVATPLAIYAIARRRTTPGRAGILAYLVLVQPAMLWGIGSPLAGMWTNALASAALAFLVELYSRPALGAKEHVAASALLAFAVLTHLFVLPVLLFLFALTTAIHHGDETLTKREATLRASGIAVAALVSARYWLTFVLATNSKRIPHQALHPLHVAARIFLPADPIYLGDNRLEEALRGDLHYIDAIPIFLLIGLGAWGALKHRKDPLVRTGAGLAVLIVAFLLVDRYRPVKWLGPVSWRLIESARMGIALAAIPALEALPLERLSRSICGAISAAAVALGFYWGAPLRHDSPESTKDELVEVGALWTWLEKNARPEWGRIYLQDTFGWEWLRGGLAQSHALVLTAEHTHLPQLGTYYGIVPYALTWTLSEFDGFYKQRLPPPEWVLAATEKTNVAAVVSSSRSVFESMRNTDAFDVLYQSEHYAVWLRRNAVNEWVNSLTPANHVGNVNFHTGEIAFDVTADYDRSRVLAKTMWHKFWHLEGVPGGRTRESPEGFLVVEGLPKGSSHVRLVWQPSPLPGLVSALGLAVFSAWAFVLLKKLRDAAPERKPEAA